MLFRCKLPYPLPVGAPAKLGGITALSLLSSAQESSSGSFSHGSVPQASATQLSSLRPGHALKSLVVLVTRVRCTSLPTPAVPRPQPPHTPSPGSRSPRTSASRRRIDSWGRPSPAIAVRLPQGYRSTRLHLQWPCALPPRRRKRFGFGGPSISVLLRQRPSLHQLQEDPQSLPVADGGIMLDSGAKQRCLIQALKAFSLAFSRLGLRPTSSTAARFRSRSASFSLRSARYRS